MQAQWVLVGSSLRLCLYVCMYAFMYVCPSVTGLRLKYTGLCIVYVPFGTCRSGWHGDQGRYSEDRRRRKNESRCMEDG